MAYGNYDVVTSNSNRKSVADPNASYESLAPTWKRIKAILGGQQTAKSYDNTLRQDGTNLLVPFSPTMTARQFSFYRDEAELPGISSQFARTVIGGMLRKPLDIELPEEVPEEALDWLRNRFTGSNRSLHSFLQEALWEEMNTSRAWCCVNYPVNPQPSRGDGGPPEPYPILIGGESVINWLEGEHPITGEQTLLRIIIRMYVQEAGDNEFHPNWVDRVWVHELDPEGNYRIRVFEKPDPRSTSAGVVGGTLQQDYDVLQGTDFVEVATETEVLRSGERLDFIPIFPLNGQIEPVEPMLTNFVDREVGLYNRISRRNHLLYGASTYTPVLKSSLSDDERQDIVASGLGSWLFIDREDDIDVLQTPSDALEDYDRAIASTLDEMSRMGMRMLSPEVEQSGTALEIRNAGQTAQLASLSRAISSSLTSIITWMVNWRYDLDISEEEVTVVLSTDLSPVPLGEEYMRLVSEWYQGGLIPRSTFLEVLRINDILPADYNDQDAVEEINADELTVSPRDQMEMEQMAMEAQAQGLAAAANGGGSSNGDQ